MGPNERKQRARGHHVWRVALLIIGLLALAAVLSEAGTAWIYIFAMIMVVLVALASHLASACYLLAAVLDRLDEQVQLPSPSEPPASSTSSGPAEEVL